MDSNKFIDLLLCCFAFVFFIVLPNGLSAQDVSPTTVDGITRFRIDNKLQIEKNDELIIISTSTIYCNNLVFDFIGDNGEIIIYNFDTQLFTLIDPLHRIQTELSVKDLDNFLVRLKELLREKDDKFVQFMLDPSFEVSRNEEAGGWMFQSKWIDYNISAVPFDEAELVESYFKFSDQSSKLNIYLNPGSMTPFARIAINQTLQQQNIFPEKISINVYPKGKLRLGGRNIKIESEHKLVRRLSEKDHGRIIRALHFTEQFPKTTFGEYYKMVNTPS